MWDGPFEPKTHAGDIVRLGSGRIILWVSRVKAVNIGIGRSAGEDRVVRARPAIPQMVEFLTLDLPVFESGRKGGCHDQCELSTREPGITY